SQLRLILPSAPMVASRYRFPPSPRTTARRPLRGLAFITCRAFSFPTILAILLAPARTRVPISDTDTPLRTGTEKRARDPQTDQRLSDNSGRLWTRRDGRAPRHPVGRSFRPPHLTVLPRLVPGIHVLHGCPVGIFHDDPAGSAGKRKG